MSWPMASPDNFRINLRCDVGEPAHYDDGAICATQPLYEKMERFNVPFFLLLVVLQILGSCAIND